MQNKTSFDEEVPYMKYKPYAKVVDLSYAICAIYEPHPFRSNVISEAVGFDVDTGIYEFEWCWVFYDWCGNPIGTSDEKPDGKDVDMFTIENLGGFSWTTIECAKKLVDYLNKDPFLERMEKNDETLPV